MPTISSPCPSFHSLDPGLRLSWVVRVSRNPDRRYRASGHGSRRSQSHAGYAADTSGIHLQGSLRWSLAGSWRSPTLRALYRASSSILCSIVGAIKPRIHPAIKRTSTRGGLFWRIRVPISTLDAALGSGTGWIRTAGSRAAVDLTIASAMHGRPRLGRAFTGPTRKEPP